MCLCACMPVSGEQRFFAGGGVHLTCTHAHTHHVLLSLVHATLHSVKLMCYRDELQTKLTKQTKLNRLLSDINATTSRQR